MIFWNFYMMLHFSNHKLLKRHKIFRENGWPAPETECRQKIYLVNGRLCTFLEALHFTKSPDFHLPWIISFDWKKLRCLQTMSVMIQFFLNQLLLHRIKRHIAYYAQLFRRTWNLVNKLVISNSNIFVEMLKSVVDVILRY